MRNLFLKKSSKQEIVKIAEFFSEKKGCFFFHSPRDEKFQKSYLFLYPNQAVSIVDEKYSKKQEKFETFIKHDENAWENLKLFLKEFNGNLEKFPKWVGFFSYEMGSKLSLTKMPYAYFQKSTAVFYFDHESKDLFLYLDENNFENLANFDKKIISQIILEKNFSKILKK